MSLKGAQAILVASLILSVSACTGSPDPNSPEGKLARGREVYTKNCASCHGDQGDGKGTAAYLLFPRPRNFQKSEFKLRSTPQGILPTDDDLFKTISQGIPGTGMFAFSEVLSEPDRRAVLDHVKTLTPAFKNAAPITAENLLKISAAPEPTPKLVALGRKTYQEFQCGKCHGPEGRGDGPSAPTLVDTSGDPFPAADFTNGIYKSGGRPEDLYRTFLTGMAGTPMPSFAEAIKNEEQAWGLVYYNFSLAPGGKPAPIAGDAGPLAAAAADRSVLSDPESAGWSALQPHRVYLRPLWYRNEYPLFVTVRAARVDNQIAILVEWKDASGNSAADREQNFADGVALQFALSDDLPFIAMGDKDSSGLCDIWHWRADRQITENRGRPETRADAYPNTVTATYPTPDFNTAEMAGNVLDKPGIAGKPVHSLTASGFGTLTARPAPSQRVQGRGVWKDGTYRVVFSAAVTPAEPGREADFRKATVPVAFAIWDGQAGDRNGTKLVSQWLMLTPGPEAAKSAEGRPR